MEEIKKYLAENTSSWKSEVEYRQVNKHWLQKSMKIAIKANRARKNLGLTQEALAQKIGVSKQNVNKVLQGRANLTIETISKLELALNIELISILKEGEIVMNQEKISATAYSFLAESLKKLIQASVSETHEYHNFSKSEKTLKIKMNSIEHHLGTYQDDQYAMVA